MKTKTKRIIVIVLINLLGIISLCIAAKILTLVNFKCIWFEKYGIYCMTCGMTRAIIALEHFKIYQAFRFNQLLFFLIGYGLFLDILTSVNYVKTGVVKIELKFIIFPVIVCMIYMLLRNIPVFSFLAPTNV